MRATTRRGRHTEHGGQGDTLETGDAGGSVKPKWCVFQLPIVTPHVEVAKSEVHSLKGAAVLSFSPAPHPSRVISDPLEVSSRLKELDEALSESFFLEASSIALRARREVTRAHAPTAAGTLHWHALVPVVRTELMAKGWLMKNHKNCPMIISADKSIAILIMTGCSATGNEFGRPRNQADKGAVLDEMVQKNAQYDLFESSALHKLKRGAIGTQMWVYLYHAEDQKNGVAVRSELSLPSAFSGKKIVDWSERIILKPLSDDWDRVIIEPIPQAPIDVHVERKTG